MENTEELKNHNLYIYIARIAPDLQYYEANTQAQPLEQEVKNIFEQVYEDKAPIPEYKILGVAFNTYILLELEDDVYILDQHAAHERILYEKVKANYYNEEEKDSQLMLLPDIITLSHKEMEIK